MSSEAGAGPNRTTETGEPSALEPGLRVSGRAMVILMILFGVTMTSAISFYWYFHSRPYRPLMYALGQEFPGSNPKIEGGRHKGGPKTLRIAMHSAFDPNDDAKFVPFRDRVLEIIPRHLDLRDFEVLELHTFYLQPQKEAVRRSWVAKVAELSLPPPKTGA